MIVGLNHRFDRPCQQLVEQIANGAIGRITRIEAVVQMGPISWNKPRAALEQQLGRSLTEMEYQLRNWVSFAWLSGDMILERLIHNLDNCLWARGTLSQRALCSATRREHKGPGLGNQSQMMSVKFNCPEPSGFEGLAEIGTASTSREDRATIHGEKGTADFPDTIVDRQGQPLWKYSGPRPDSYQEEMNQWCGSIRQSKAINTCDSAADSTLAAIMCRTAAYTGREITWAEVERSKEAFFTHNPKSFQDDPPCLPNKFGDYPFPPQGQ